MTNNNPTRILFYCQSLAGIGHLTASLQVISKLLQHSDVDLIYGGHKIDITLDHRGFRHISLHTILIDETTDSLYDPNRQFSVDQLWPLRAEQIRTFLSQPYDAAIVEFFPFGRRKFKKEIHALFKRLRDHHPAIPICTFVREVLVPGAIEVEQRIVQSINEHIHTVFIRGDPNVIRFEETFSSTGQIADKIVYLGCVGSALPETRPARSRQILVSRGGGSRGRELLEAAIRTAPLLLQHPFLIATGSQTTAADFAHLADLVSSDNVTIVPFLQNFKSQLLESALSISLGGDNTLIDVISSHTPALAFPYPGDSEQAMRIGKLAEKGFIHSLRAEDLLPETLREKILTALMRPYPKVDIAMGGAEKMSERIKDLIALARMTK